jgi:putative hydrolase
MLAAPCAIDLATDHHLHSTFSDGKDTLEANLAAAEAAGVKHLGCVEHVRRDTTWVKSYVDAVRALRPGRDITITAGIEAKLLNQHGALDLPENYTLADVIYIADHQFPWYSAPIAPRTVREWIDGGVFTTGEAIDHLVTATNASLERYAGHSLVIAHLFSILPKLGIDESKVPRALIARLANTASSVNAVLEVSERWVCPSLSTVRVFLDYGVSVVASTDSHRASTIGRYEYVRDVAAAI